MSDAKRTPWTLGSPDGFNVSTVHEGDSGIASVFGLPINCRVADPDLQHPMWAEGLARGRLIAAAPDLLEALRDLLASARGRGPKDGKVMSRADAAIAKAEGQP